MRLSSTSAFALIALTGCSSDPAPSSSTSSSSSGTASNENRIGGIVIPASLPLCTSTTGGIFIASSGGSNVGWTWSPTKNGGTHYAIKITKAPPGATTTTTLIDKLVPATDRPEIMTGERDKGTYYGITGAIVKDSTPLCTMDGANGITP
jgi:hypothetical protein